MKAEIENSEGSKLVPYTGPLTQEGDLPDLGGIVILVIDPDPSLLRQWKRFFSHLGARVFLAGDLSIAEKLIYQEQIHVILTELKLESGSSLELFGQYKSFQPEGYFYVMTSQGSVQEAMNISKLGIHDYFEKPLDLSKFAWTLEENFRGRKTSLRRVDSVVAELQSFLLFRSEVMQRGLMVLPRLAASKQSVLITGETGTGKELVARAVHGLSPFSNGPFVAVNCGAIPENLIEGELFGHEKGAFTNAYAARKGKFELAEKGTLFLDEIGEMPLILQVRLLRVLEEGHIYRVGGEKPIPIHVRIVAATRQDLEKAVDDGLFREDLYYRLNILRIQLPPLRERPDDVPLLAWHFLERAFSETNKDVPFPHLSETATDLLQQQWWKGNVRELRNLMTRIAILLPDEARQILPEHILPHLTFREPPVVVPTQETAFSSNLHEMGAKVISDPYENFSPNDFKEEIDVSPSWFRLSEKSESIEHTTESSEKGVFVPVGSTLQDAEDLLIEVTLKETNGNRTKAAKILGIGVRTLRRRLNEQS